MSKTPLRHITSLCPHTALVYLAVCLALVLRDSSYCTRRVALAFGRQGLNEKPSPFLMQLFTAGSLFLVFQFREPVLQDDLGGDVVYGGFLVAALYHDLFDGFL